MEVKEKIPLQSIAEIYQTFPGGELMLTTTEKFFKWAQVSSFWPLTFGLACCAISGGIFRNSYAVVPGVDRIIPVDVFVPGCPPVPEALMDGILKLQDKIKNSKNDYRKVDR